MERIGSFYFLAPNSLATLIGLSAGIPIGQNANDPAHLRMREVTAIIIPTSARHKSAQNQHIGGSEFSPVCSQSLALGESTHQVPDGGLGQGDCRCAAYSFAVCQISKQVQNITRIHVSIHDSWSARYKEHNLFINSRLTHYGVPLNLQLNIVCISVYTHRTLGHNSLELGHDSKPTELQKVGGATVIGCPPRLPQPKHSIIFKLCKPKKEQQDVIVSRLLCPDLS